MTGKVVGPPDVDAPPELVAKLWQEAADMLDHEMIDRRFARPTWSYWQADNGASRHLAFTAKPRLPPNEYQVELERVRLQLFYRFLKRHKSTARLNGEPGGATIVAKALCEAVTDNRLGPFKSKRAAAKELLAHVNALLAKRNPEFKPRTCETLRKYIDDDLIKK